MNQIYKPQVPDSENIKQTTTDLDFSNNPFLECLRDTIKSDNRWGRELKLSPSPARRRSDDPVALLELNRPVSGADKEATLKHITRAIFPALTAYNAGTDNAKIRVTVKGPDAPFVKKESSLRANAFFHDVKTLLQESGFAEQQILLARMRLQGVDYHLGIVRSLFKEGDQEKLSLIRERILETHRVHLRFEYLSPQFKDRAPRTQIVSRRSLRSAALQGIVESWEEIPFLSHDTRLRDRPEDMSHIESKSDGSKVLRLCSPIVLKARAHFEERVPTLSIGFEVRISPLGSVMGYKFMPVNAALWMPVNHELYREIESNKINHESVETALRKSESLGIDLREQVVARREIARLITAHQMRLGRVLVDAVDVHKERHNIISSEIMVQRFLSFQDGLFAKWLKAENIPFFAKRHTIDFESLIPKIVELLPGFQVEDLNDPSKRSLLVSILRTKGQGELAADLARRILGAAGSYKPIIIFPEHKLHVDDAAPAKVADRRDSDLACINQLQLCLNYLNLKLLTEDSMVRIAQALISIRNGATAKNYSQAIKELSHIRKKLRTEFGVVPNFV